MNTFFWIVQGLRGEYSIILGNVVLLSLAIIVAYGRFIVSPII